MLTAAEWNERYPDGTPVRFDGQVWTTVGPAGSAAGADGAWLTLRGCGFSAGPRDVSVDDVELLATDTERLAAGWLDPAGVDIVWAARDQAIAERDALLDALDAAKAHNDANCSSLHLLAAQEPVVDAARNWRGMVRLTEAIMGTESGSEWCLTPQSRALADAVDALDDEPSNAEDIPC